MFSGRRLRLPVALAMVAGVLGGCDDPLGLVRIHFSLRPPRVVDLGDPDAGPPPVDAFDLSRAAGTVQVYLDLEPKHMSTEVQGLPVPTDPERTYLLWVSASDRGGDWVLADHLEPQPSGAAAAHLDQPAVPLAYPTVRAAIVTLDTHDAIEPSHAVVLTGAVGQDPEPAAAAAPGGGGGHVH